MSRFYDIMISLWIFFKALDWLTSSFREGISCRAYLLANTGDRALAWTELQALSATLSLVCTSENSVSFGFVSIVTVSCFGCFGWWVPLG